MSYVTDDLSADEIMRHKAKHFRAKVNAARAAEWRTVRIPDKKPIGIIWFGDPHLDDDGCDIELLRKHTEICRTNPGVYGVNIGDVTNNWTGRLFQQYANQSTSLKRARKLAKWFMLDSGVKWLLWLAGNHDAWEHGQEILELISAQRVPIEDWQAKFVLKFHNKTELRVHAAHDFAGHSSWNIGHGPMKTAMLGSEADLLMCGHKHTGIITTFEHAGRVRTIARARGYKFMDRYSRRHGFPETTFAPSIMTIIDPAERDPSARVMSFADPVIGARVLKALRR